ncbi:hypothetical protein DEU56DRAFT_412098 [Suillus clintonianus]|uniref:uncharacterized protein n=1 Tax=Suillus clintonianus TaxID=1904413 RepID=UPI001B873EAE|nr:uncharacterized protein DEU56DRAFT_412098 [Suillus clintonianus]KAG2134097.1 hypothetical protein DEU56DRAFT_412098 [Suillus clintonianus]
MGVAVLHPNILHSQGTASLLTLVPCTTCVLCSRQSYLVRVLTRYDPDNAALLLSIPKLFYNTLVVHECQQDLLGARTILTEHSSAFIYTTYSLWLYIECSMLLSLFLVGCSV